MTALPSPQARRLTRPRWTEPRLLLGVVLVLVAVALGARVFAGAESYQRVWMTTRALDAGEPLTQADVTPVRVRLFAAVSAYLDANRPVPVGYLLTRTVGTHELLPFAALRPAAGDPTSRLVAVPVTPGHLPGGLASGDRVDVWVTPHAATGGPAGAPRLVVADVSVVDRDGGGQTLGVSETLTDVVVSVPAFQVAALIAAIQTGSVDLVVVPQ